MDVVERAVTGLPEMIRAMTAVKTPRAYLSRGAAGIRGRTLTVNLPGSVKAVDECFASLASVLNHALETLTGVTARCGG